MAGSQAFAVFVVVLAVACGLLSQYAGEIAVQGPAPGSSVHPTKAPLPSRWVLGSPEYDVKVLDAPIATGWKLHVVQWMLTKSFIGPILRRLLLNNNQVVMLRELAYQVRVQCTLPQCRCFTNPLGVASLTCTRCSVETVLAGEYVGGSDHVPASTAHVSGAACRH